MGEMFLEVINVIFRDSASAQKDSKYVTHVETNLGIKDWKSI